MKTTIFGIICGLLLMLFFPKVLIAEETFPFVYSLTQHPVDMPMGMRDRIVQVFMECEVREAVFASGGSPQDAVNPASGASGFAQIHPIHRKGMRAMGLDYNSEQDRLYFAAYLWEQQGWEPWECANGQ